MPCMYKKKKKHHMMDHMKPTFVLAGGSMGMAMIGGAMQPHLPVGMSNPMLVAGQATSNIIPLTVAVGGMATSSQILKNLLKEMKGIK